MANHFKTVPAVQLSELLYTVLINGPYNATGNSPTLFSQGVKTSVNMQFTYAPSVVFNFNTAGSFGNFDQDAAEAGIKTWVSSLCAGISTLTGQNLNTVQNSVTINRQWTWTDGAGSVMTFQDTLAFP